MRYRISSARRAFAAINNRLLCDSILAAGVSERKVSQLAYQGAIIQIHSSIEVYVTAILEDWCFVRNAATSLNQNLPKPLRSWLVHKDLNGAYKSFQLSKSEKDILQALSFASTTLKLIRDDSGTIAIYSSEIISEHSYPSFKNLEKVFNRLGFAFDAFASKSLRQGARLYFEAFSTTRTTIAHQSAGELTITDVRKFSSRADTIVQLLDRAFFDALCKNTNSNVWPS